jgi:replicative DNA helicase
MQSSITLEKPLPHNLEAERAIIGAILLEPTYLFQASESVIPEDFYLEANRKIFSALVDMQQGDVGIDLVTVKNELQKRGQLEASGGAGYLANLTDGLPRAMNIPHYAKIVKDASVRRSLIQLASQTMESGYQDDESNKEIIDRLQMALLKISDASKKRGWAKVADLVAEAYKEIEEIAQRKAETIGLDTGFKPLNKLTQGFHPGDLVIIAGRPAHGKSSIVANIVMNGALKHSWRVGYFTLEMSGNQVIKRAMYSEAEVDSHRAGSGYLTTQDWGRLAKAAGRIAATNIQIDDSGSLNIMDFRSRSQSLAVMLGGLDLIVVDYLQLMSGTSRRSDNRANELSEITRGLKNVARDLNVPIIALSQLNREIEKEKNRLPCLADLRESGSIEQDADTVMFIWREYLRSGNPADINRAQLILSKQRNGPTANIDLVFLANITKFVDATNQAEFPECE